MSMSTDPVIELELGSRPYRQYNRFELPKRYELDDWESEDDTWIKIDREFYNLREFCTVGMGTIIPGAQLASNGYHLIAGYDGEVWPVQQTVYVPFWRWFSQINKN